MSLKRRKPIVRRTPLRRKSWLKRSTKRIRSVSLKHAKALKEYFKVRAEYLAENEWCEAGPVILKAKLPEAYSVPYCTIKATQVHHTARRGPNLCRKETFCACCAACHRWIETHAQKSRELGLLV